MKRYLLFAFPQFYPAGGWNDFVDSFASVSAACAYVNSKEAKSKYTSCDFQLIDGKTGKELDL